MQLLNSWIPNRMRAMAHPTDLIRSLGVQGWRELIYDYILVGILGLGFIALVPSVWLSFSSGEYGLGVFDLLVYGAVIILAHNRRWDFSLRVLTLLSLVVSIGLVVFSITGAQGAGLYWLFVVPPLAALLLGNMQGFGFMGLNAFILVGIGYLITTGFAQFPGMDSYSVSGWAVIAVNFLVTNLVVTVPLGRLMGGLVSSAGAIEDASALNDIVVSASPDGILAYEAQSGQCVLANQAAADLVGGSREHLLTQTFRQISSWQPSGLLAMAEATLFTNHRSQLDTQFMTTFGKQVFLHCESASFQMNGKQHLLLSMTDLSEINQAKEALEAHVVDLEAVSAVSQALGEADRLASMLPALLDAALDALGAEAGSVWLYDQASDTVRVEHSKGYVDEAGRQVQVSPEKRGEGLAGLLVERNEAFLTAEYTSDSRVPQSLRERVPAGVGGATAPIRANGEAIGLLMVNVEQPQVLDASDLDLLCTLANIAGNAIQRAMLFEQSQRGIQRLLALAEIDKAINANLDLTVTLQTLASQVKTQLDVDAVNILLFNQESRELECTYAWGFRSPTFGLGKTVRLGASFAGQVALDRKKLLLPDFREHEIDRQLASAIQGEGFVGYLGLPLISKGQLKGVIEVYQRSTLNPDSDWLDFLSTLAAQASIAIDNAGLLSDLRQSNLELEAAYDATIEGWSRALDLRDEETEGHSQRVTALAVELARKLGVRGEALAALRRGALLHDIGKMGIPDDILGKPGPLSTDEWETMRRHPEYGCRMLQPIEYLRDAMDIPCSHHEKWDGTGYPRGLQGRDIPFPARIFAVADVYDALTSDRPYRKAWSRDAALEYIRQERGKHFEPAVADAFLAMIKGE